jgi:hypothetical protein
VWNRIAQNYSSVEPAPSDSLLQSNSPIVPPILLFDSAKTKFEGYWKRRRSRGVERRRRGGRRRRKVRTYQYPLHAVLAATSYWVTTPQKVDSPLLPLLARCVAVWYQGGVVHLRDQRM